MSQTISGTYKLPPMMSGLVGSPYGAYSYPVKTAPIAPQINYNTSNINANIPGPAQFTNQPTTYVPQMIVRKAALEAINSTPSISPKQAEEAKSSLNKVLSLGLSTDELYALMKEYSYILDNQNITDKPSFIDFIQPYLSNRKIGAVGGHAPSRSHRRYRTTKKGRKNRKH